MSDETTPAVPPAGSSPAHPAPPPVVRLTAEEDTYWIRHLGLPFFYRHLPQKWVLRIGFYLGLALVLGLLCYEQIVIPLMSSSYYYSHWYRNREMDVVWEFFVIAVIISCIIAPLLSTSSLCNERVTGTMEFLRLAPLSPTGIVLGKTFGPVIFLHLGAVLLMIVASLVAIAVAGWSALGAKICLALPLILLSAVLTHAVGALLASISTFMRGMFPLIALMGLMFVQQVVPLGIAQSSEMSAMGFFSPWGVLNEALGNNWRWRNEPIRFLNSEDMAVPFVVFASLVLIALLFRAAARRLDSPLRSALSPLGYVTLWGLLVMTCAGIGLNEFQWGRRASGMEAAAVFLGVCGVILLILMILDHPHRREVLLGSACERIQRGVAIPGSFRHLGHAGLVTLLALFGAALLILLLLFCSTLSRRDWGWVALMMGVPPLIAFLLCLFMEANQVGLRNALVRFGVLIVGCGLLGGLILGVAIDVAYTFDIWQECVNVVRNSGGAKPALHEDTQVVASLKTKYPGYMACLKTPEDVNTVAGLMNEWPVFFFIRYHPVYSVIYLCLWFLWMAAIVLWRWLAYRSLRREAEKAVREQALPVPRAPLPAAS